ncbi:MAG: MBL fold metallo-hydrolase [Dysgonamonadaceae bacterium]|jgi:uncharacterized pyridoxamine 5'-phosphate oxidase family protein/glyoxylase-like metal-dependent hydrolase (beta-lactamase superfamily II)|nr:MBL fold metallo-hydrolase [Dysgonamonadaceae bacterium]
MKKIITTSILILLFGAIVAQNPQLPSWTFGDYTLTLLSEGQGKGNTSILPEANNAILTKYAPDGTFPIATNCFLLSTKKGKNILVDAGYGKLLFEKLNSLNIKSENIDFILLTHLHGDHIGGLMKDGKPTFPKAQVYVAKAEFDYWAKQDNPLAKSVLTSYKKQIKTFVPDEIGAVSSKKFLADYPEIKPIAAYGHTPGHCMYLINTEKPLLIWGDIIHAMAVQIPHPEISVIYDVNPDSARLSRWKTLDYVAKNNITIAGMHIAYPAVGTIEKTGEQSFKFINKQENMKEVCRFLNDCGFYYIATLDDDNQPRVRPFGTATIFEDKLYIQTGKKKNVAKQMLKNPKVEICAHNISAGKWLRIEAEVVEDERIEAKEFILEQYPSLKSMYDARDSNTLVLYLENVTATYSSFTEDPRVVKW